MGERETSLRRLEERLARASSWFSERSLDASSGAKELRTRTDAIRGELERVRRSIGAVAREDVARVRASVEGFGRDYDVPPPHFAVRREEVEAYRRHLATIYRLVPILSNADDPRWDEANEEYERSWIEVQRLFEPEGDAAGR
jgi:hypothetical protein